MPSSFSRGSFRIAALDVAPLAVPLVEPFVIATGRMDATRAGLVRATVENGEGQTAVGLGEAACLPPVTREDQADVLATVPAARPVLLGASWRADDGFAALASCLDSAFPSSPVARAAVELACLDAIGHLLSLPVSALLDRTSEGMAGAPLVTDITLPIGDPAHMADLAVAHATHGFLAFKVKIGRDVREDIEALLAVFRAVPTATFLLDANAGFTTEQALSFLAALPADLRASIRCFEQPCPTDDKQGLAEVAARSGIPVIADESVKTMADLTALSTIGAAAQVPPSLLGVNLKIAKSGGALAAHRIGAAAKAQGRPVMCGAMVETWLGITAAAHIVSALGGVDFVDLDTAILLADNPFEGGLSAEGPKLAFTRDANGDLRGGLGIQTKAAKAASEGARKPA